MLKRPRQSLVWLVGVCGRLSSCRFFVVLCLCVCVFVGAGLQTLCFTDLHAHALWLVVLRWCRTLNFVAGGFCSFTGIAVTTLEATFWCTLVDCCFLLNTARPQPVGEGFKASIWTNLVCVRA